MNETKTKMFNKLPNYSRNPNKCACSLNIFSLPLFSVKHHESIQDTKLINFPLGQKRMKINNDNVSGHKPFENQMTQPSERVIVISLQH